MEASRSVVVFGAGPMGGSLGVKLGLAPRSGRAGRLDVTLVGRRPVVEAVEARGLILRERGYESVAHPVAATSASGVWPCDMTVLSVRAYDVQDAIPVLRERIGETGFLLAMQNGVGSEEQLAEALGCDRVLVGTLTVSVGMEQPGVITRYSRQGGVALATMTEAAVPQWIVDAFHDTDLPTVVLEDYRSLRWSKLLLNMLGAATSAILDVDMASVVAYPPLFHLEQLAFREAGRVMDAEGIRTVALPGYPVPLARQVMRLPRALAHRLLAPSLARARGGRSPTMRADMARGRSEIGDLNGAVVKAASRLGLPAPVNRALTELTQDLVQHPERRETFQGRPDRFIAYMKERGIEL